MKRLICIDGRAVATERESIYMARIPEDRNGCGVRTKELSDKRRRPELDSRYELAYALTGFYQHVFSAAVL